MFAAFLLAASLVPTEGLDYYLPEGVERDASIPTPKAVLGTEVGEWHARHDQVVEYYRRLAEASPRMQLMEYGRTHEQRALLLLAVSSPDNIQNLEALREAHREAAVGEGETSRGPVVSWMGYSVHGNEASGTNAALLVAYYLAAARGPEIDRLLTNSIILVDPCINPDGFSRFAEWANSHRGRELVSDPNHREHREEWPGGRTNHYWFDLNRDWLLLTHPESRGRLEQFHRWKPNLLTDFHEMGTDSTYFFQPGVPSRQNPHTPARNLDLTRKIAEFHAQTLDRMGSLYYTEETFDDFYYGKGSTYPDVNGAIGILFEQASSRGHVQDSSFGPLTFPFTIRNQFRTSLSSLQAAVEMRDELLRFQGDFFRRARVHGAEDSRAGYVFEVEEDPARAYHLIDILQRHQIDVYRLAADLNAGDQVFARSSAYFVPLAQTQYHLIRSLFEQPIEFADHTFYDVSAWTLPLCFGVRFLPLERGDFPASMMAGRVDPVSLPAGKAPGPEPAYAYAFEWHGYYAPRTLQRVLAAGFRPRVATRRFVGTTRAGPHEFDLGTVLIPTGPQDVPLSQLTALFEAAAAEDGVTVHALESGLTGQGVDLGSPSLREIAPVRALAVVGSGTSSYEAGELWYLLDQRYRVPLSLVEANRLTGISLSDYSHVFLVSGSANALPGRAAEELREWVRRGGVVVAQRSSTAWAQRELLQRDAAKEPENDEPEGHSADRAYGDYEALQAETLVSGTIFEARLDRTHPLCFGYRQDRLPLFRSSMNLLAPTDDPFATPVRYTSDPLLSGFVSAENLARLKDVPAVIAERSGRGIVICLSDNPSFRGVWYGTSKLVANSLFFARAIRSTGRLDRDVSGLEEEQHEE